MSDVVNYMIKPRINKKLRETPWMPGNSPIRTWWGEGLCVAMDWSKSFSWSGQCRIETNVSPNLKDWSLCFSAHGATDRSPLRQIKWVYPTKPQTKGIDQIAEPLTPVYLAGLSVLRQTVLERKAAVVAAMDNLLLEIDKAEKAIASSITIEGSPNGPRSNS